MAKTSEWKIVATEGNTIDDRIILKEWIQDMAETYSLDEYTAMIWPEHFRSTWGPFEGKNWGFVSEVKAEKRAGKMRLIAKITPNQYLLSANADGQKLFSSIEIKENYAGTGKCYLRGLAVTDSPASTGAQMLKFSIGNENIEREAQLEPLNLSEFSDESRFRRFYSVMRDLFGTEELTPTDTQPQPEDTEVTEEQLKAALAETLQPFTARLDAIEQKFTAAPAPATPQEGGEETPPADNGETFNAEQFSAALNEALTPMVEKLNGLETQFNSLLQEEPGQRPLGEGASNNVEIW
ncbi:GPO family capsid scaffolding protein [Enterovibrio norvegicus]|uniref:GPO family capsid scaffolding protein n=1 Tax=Enterovibrio norvegicus TaxID=188144 RepID=UPI000C83C721|nr:GPO family capsid scaffolding protein [Enterovibrio norvegicus]PMN68403.1 hypothetical protein BCT27_23665 [Enterovibrio norvegicus]